MRGQLLSAGFDLGSSRSPIIPIYVREPKTLYEFGRALYNNGIFSVSIAFPAVKLNEGRLRFILNASHTYPQIDKTIGILKSLGAKMGIIPGEGG
jgi:glycine C-acetyltransferase